ncbi:MAG: exonuclease domain-containing protein [Candidatus Saccharibacteria bacterium]|nr:exonuclease domain-containing protein [Moraxellaceae bacterium]
MSRINYSEIVVIDLEATCWSTPEETALNASEIIEVGVCVLDTFSGEIRMPQGIIVKPTRSKVSQFCYEITNISQDMVDDGVSFEDAIKTLKSDYKVSQKIMAGYGNYDQNMFAKECARNGVKPPFGPTYLNISSLATLKLKAGKRLDLAETCRQFGLIFEGRQHRGVDDAVMAAKVLWECIK